MGYNCFALHWYARDKLIQISAYNMTVLTSMRNNVDCVHGISTVRFLCGAWQNTVHCECTQYAESGIWHGSRTKGSGSQDKLPTPWVARSLLSSRPSHISSCLVECHLHISLHTYACRSIFMCRDTQWFSGFPSL